MTQLDHQKFLILVVDDTRKNLQLVIEILDEAGYLTTFAVDGKQALQRVPVTKPDLILLDIMMPEMNGIEVCRTLKNDKNYQNIPIIFLTAMGEQSTLMQAFEEGAVDYITKPFKKYELLARVKTHLELKQTRDKLLAAYLRLEQLVLTDPLTGVPNRRYLLQAGEQEFSRTRRYQRPLSILMIDIDYFRNINNDYGHDVGDKALKLVATTIQQCLRSVDEFGRFGGEEFVVLLPETKIEDALSAAERIRQSVAQIPLELESIPRQITVSIGVAEFINTDESLEQLLKRADEALFKAKDQGRNQTVAGTTS
jgi:diguanylate cyclase (GGDEF)-like protein